MRALLLCLLPVFCQAEPFYVGGAVGQVDAGQTALDYGFFLGWQADSHFAVEAGYLDLNHGDTVNLDLVASQPLDSLLPVTKGVEVYGKVGVSFLSLDVPAASRGKHGHHSTPAPTLDANQDCLNYGFGLGYNVNRLRVRAGMEWITPDGLSALRVSNLSFAVKF